MLKLLNFCSIIFLHFAPKLQGAAIQSEESGDQDRTNVDREIMFSYKTPEEWNTYNTNCNGTRQSPVNILSTNMARVEKANPLIWKQYREQPLNMSLENNGHTGFHCFGFVKKERCYSWAEQSYGDIWIFGQLANIENDYLTVKIEAQWKSITPYITGGVAGDSVYVFNSIHFHWADNDQAGSEHKVNNYSFPIEMHVVHRNNRYQSFEKAQENYDGLLVVAFFYELNEESNYALDSIREGLKSIKEIGTRVNIKPFPLERFHLEFHDKYTAYVGSLTTPPCQESVLWILSSEPLSVTRKQIDMLRTVQLSNEDNHNNRPTQPLNSRRIFYFSDTE